MEILASMNLTDEESKCDSKRVWKANEGKQTSEMVILVI